MQFINRSVFGFFDGTKKSFIIPVYQRAFSWKEKEWKNFLDDLIEQIEGKANYFFGNILLEIIEKDRIFEVIDGQQRLTTLTIFIRSIICVLQERIDNGEVVSINLAEKEMTFLKNGGTIKLRPVDYDRACYDALIIDGKQNFPTSTPSQDNIKESKSWFIKELRKLSTSDIDKILNKVESTSITSIELEGKKDAALMFELQNNRGKDLTDMEKLKSYFMYQLYVNSTPENAESNIDYVGNIFKGIYILINDIRDLDEDSILTYHCHAYLRGYSYRSIEDIKYEFKNSDKKINWINRFVEELHTTFFNIKKLENSKDVNYLNLVTLKIPAWTYPFLIKGYKFFGEDKQKLSELFKITEILVFRFYVIRSGADIRSRLNSVLMSFQGVLKNLRDDLKYKLNQEYHWSDDRFKNTLDGYMYKVGILNYLLWSYEASIQKKGYVLGTFTLEDEQIEHISPQTPPNGEHIASGYDLNSKNEYSDDFVRDYLHCLGNLMLISGNHNRSIGNISFDQKLDSYKLNPLLNQQAEVKSFLDKDNANLIWDMEAIDKRHNSIFNFSLSNWNFDNVVFLN